MTPRYSEVSATPIMIYPNPEQRQEIVAAAAAEFGPRGLSRFMVDCAMRRVRQLKRAKQRNRAALLRGFRGTAKAPLFIKDGMVRKPADR